MRTLRAALDQHRLADLPLAAIGGSFGGYLALSVACAVETKLVAAHAAPIRPREVAMGSDAFWSWTREWGPLTEHARLLEQESLDLSLLPRRTRVLLSHGMLDEQVPFHQSVTAARELRIRGVRCDLVLVPDGGHALNRPDWVTKWYEWTIEALHDAGEL